MYIYFERVRRAAVAAALATPPETDEWVSALPVPVFISPKTLKLTRARASRLHAPERQGFEPKYRDLDTFGREKTE